MPEYLSPGVYVEEIDAGPKPIEGVSTSTAGAVGVTERGPSEGKPLLVTSFADFVRTFGGPLAEPDPGLQISWSDKADGGEWWRFALAVKGFFDNGGQRLFVKRVDAKNATAASVELKQGLYLDIDKPAKATDSTLVMGRTSGLTGLAETTAVELTRIDGTQALARTVARYDGGASTVTFTAPLGVDVNPELWVLGVKTGASVFTDASSLTVQASSKGAWGKKIRMRMRPAISATLQLMPNPATANNASASTRLSAKTAVGDTTIEIASLAGFANNDTVEIGPGSFTISALAPLVDFGATPIGAAVSAGNDVRILPGPKTTDVTAAIAVGATQIVVTDASALNAGDEVVVDDVVYTLGAPAGTTFPIAPTATVASTSTELRRVKGKTTAAAGAGTSDTKLSLTAAATAAAGDKLLVSGHVLDIVGVRPSAVIAPAATVELPAGTTVRRKLATVDPLAPQLVYLTNASRLYENALLEFDSGTTKTTARVKSRVGSKVELFSNLPAGTYFDTDVARLIEGRLQVAYQRDPAEPVTTETFDNLRLRDDSSPQYVDARLEHGSQLLRVQTVDGTWNGLQPDLASFPSVKFGGWATLDGGDDKLDELTTDDFVGEDKGPGQRSGITALEDIDEISICLAPGVWADGVRKALIEHCELLKDRFAVVDPTPALELADTERVDPETIKAKIDSKYGAVYYPWLIGRDFVAGKDVRLPPSGHVAGIYARSDVERGVHKAPANEVVRGIESFELDISKREQDILNPKGVNALRYFPGRGLRVWGARTLSSDGSWKYVNVRRLFIFVEESIDEGTQWVVFEPNDERLWARVRQTINQFLERLWRDGMLMGATRDEAYFVKCDRTTMTQDDIDNGRLICVIGIAPVKPAEFVVFRIQQKTLDQKA